MSVIFVSRHKGAIEWMKKKSVRVDRWVSHLHSDEVEPGDVVIGVLPMYLAAEICEKGGTYYALELELPLRSRGLELSSEELDDRCCRLHRYVVTRQD